MGDNVCLLSTIQLSASETVVDLIPELIAPELDALCWVKFRYQNGEPLRSKVFSYAAKIFDTEFLAEPKNSMNQDEIHDWRMLAPFTLFGSGSNEELKRNATQ